ncbi:MAG: dolichyl-phosphate-mannose--protein mannosyltransferase [Kineosporiaceae bacterium]
MAVTTLDAPASGGVDPPGSPPGRAPRPRRPLDPRVAEVRARLRRTLGVDHPEPAWWGWAVALALGALAGVLRFWRLGNPAQLVFDETYYVKQAYSFLLSGGVEWRWDNEPSTSTLDGSVTTSPGADQLFTSGTLDVFTRQADFVVHPPLGKWMIAAGMEAYGADDPVGWRLAAAVCGTLMVVVVTLVARRLFASTLLGAVAGLLLAVDGHHLVHSRTSLLDIFLAFWVLVAFAFLVADRFWFRARLADRTARLAAGRDGPLTWGPPVLFRPWLLAAGVALGAACATKWSGAWVLAGYGLLVVAWDIGARRGTGVRRWFSGSALRDGVVAFVHLVPVAVVTYVATWFGWFRSEDGYDRFWARDNPDALSVRLLPDPLASLLQYHSSMLDFHVGLDSEHSYMANPWSWLIMGRPTSFFYESPGAGEMGCPVEACSRAITSVGNPVVWWGGTIAVVVALLAWVVRRDWRAGAVLAPLAAGYLPWFAYQDRTVYTFYAVAFVPFVVLALTYVLGLLVGRPDADPRRRSWGAAAAGVVVILAVGCLWFFWPVWTAEVIPREQWQLRMWWPSWI